MTSVAPQLVESSRRLISRNRSIVTSTRDLIACSRRSLNPWWGLSGGSDERDTQQFRALVRQRLERGNLVPAPRTVWAGKGTGQRCVVCGRDVQASEIEGEINVRADGLEVTLWTHLSCLAIWREESEALRSGGPAFPE